MSGRHDHGWSGLDLFPLPYESSLSALWRLGWRNVLSAGQLAKLCKGKGKSVGRHSFLGTKWIDRTEFTQQTGWNLPEPEELSVIENLGELMPILFSKKLRICPICMTRAYHSIWFQFLPLRHCPIHHCELSTQCQSCGGDLVCYEISNVFYSKAYCCISCWNPIAGIAPELQAHLDFRDSSNLHRAFARYQDWALTSKGKLVLLTGIARKSMLVKRAEGIQWCKSDQLLISIAHSLHSFPKECTPVFYSNLTILCWKQKRDENGPPLWANWQCKKDRIGSIIPVYRCTLRLLQSWIIGDDCRCIKDDAREAPRFQEKNVVNVLAWDPRELAFMLFRHLHEAGENWGVRASVRHAQLKDETPASSPSQGSSPRLASRAFFLANYVGLFYTVLNARRNGKLDLKNTRLTDEYLAAGIQFVNNETYTGGVIFPRLEGFPIKPFTGNFDKEILNSIGEET